VIARAENATPWIGCPHSGPTEVEREQGLVHGSLLFSALGVPPAVGVRALVPEDGIVAHAMLIENIVVNDPHGAALAEGPRAAGLRHAPTLYFDACLVGASRPRIYRYK